MRGSTVKMVFFAAIVLVLVLVGLDTIGLNPFEGVLETIGEEIISTQIVQLEEDPAELSEEVTPTLTPTIPPTQTFTPQPTQTPTEIPLVESQFLINGQVFVDLCEELEVREVEHICPIVDREIVPLDGYFIAFEDYDLEKGLYFEEGVNYFCPTGEVCNDGFVIMDREAPTFFYNGPAGPGSVSYLNERYLLFYVPAEFMANIQAHYDFANTPGIDPQLMRNFNSKFLVHMYISHDVMRTMAEIGVQHMTYTWEIDCRIAPPGTHGCDD